MQSMGNSGKIKGSIKSKKYGSMNQILFYNNNCKINQW